MVRWLLHLITINLPKKDYINTIKQLMISVVFLSIIYNIPGRSVIDMSVDTMARLFELKNIIGVKDATGDLK